MTTQIYTFKITYADCENKIWRIAEVSVNNTLAQLGYMVLATFDTMAYHLFNMECKGITYFLIEDEFVDLRRDRLFDLLSKNRLKTTINKIGEHIKMTYDMGCEQDFDIELISISDMLKEQRMAYPRIIDGAGQGIIDDMHAFDLLELIHRIDETGISDVCYDSSGNSDDKLWDYRNYNFDTDNRTLKGKIRLIRAGFEEYDDE